MESPGRGSSRFPVIFLILVARGNVLFAQAPPSQQEKRAEEIPYSRYKFGKVYGNRNCNSLVPTQSVIRLDSGLLVSDIEVKTFWFGTGKRSSLH